MSRTFELFPVLAYDPESMTFLQRDQSLSFAFLCEPIQGWDQALEDRMNVLLNQDWPVDTIVQFSLFTSPDTSRPINAMLEMREDQDDPLLVRGLEQRRDFLAGGTDRHPIEPVNGLYLRNVQVIVSVKVPIAAPKPSAQDMESVGGLRIAMEQALSTCSMRPQAMDAQAHIRFMSVALNWGPLSEWRNFFQAHFDPHELINHQYFDYDTDVALDRHGLRVGNRRVVTMSAKRMPDALHFGSAMSLLGEFTRGARGIREPLLFTVNLVFPDAVKARVGMEAKRNYVIQQSGLPIARYVPTLAQKRESFELITEALEDGDRICKAWVGLALFCDGVEAAQRAASNARTYLREIGYQMLEDAFIQLPAFLNLMPMCADLQAVGFLQRYKTYATRHVLPMLPVFGDWKGTGTPLLTYVSRNGQLMGIDPWDTDGSMNVFIAAKSGSGKSFMVNDLVTNTLTLPGSVVFIIDVGRSYQKACEVYGGDFIVFSGEKPICMNPFPLVRNYDDEADSLVNLVETMASPREGLDKFQLPALRKVMKHVWEEKGREMTIDDIAEACERDEDQRIKDIARMLFSWTSAGEFGRYVNGPNTVSFGNRFTVLELEELKSRPSLQQIVLLILMYQIRQAFYSGSKAHRKLLVIDEAWDLLTKGDVATFIAGIYRTIRKYNGAAVTITQGVNDLYDSASGRAIAENSPNMYLLAQEDASIDALRASKRISIPDGLYEWLKSVHTLPGRYSEVFFNTPRGMGIGRLVTEPFRLLLNTTKAEEVELIQRVQREHGLDVAEAIQYVLDNDLLGRKAA